MNRRSGTRGLLLLVGACFGCAREAPQAPVAPAPPSMASVPPAGAAPSAPSTAPPAASSAPDASAAEALVFRQIVAGALTFPPRRLTWTLLREAHRVRLRVACELGKREALSGVRGLKVDGREQDPTLWAAPATAELEGRDDGAGASVALSMRTDPEALAPCTTANATVVLACERRPIRVLHAGAVLRADPSGRAKDGRMPWRWQPAATEDVEVLACKLAKADADAGPFAPRDPFGVVRSDWALAFVAPREDAAGIEWVVQNDDAVVQAGAYRWRRPE